jgi:putative ATPase
MEDLFGNAPTEQEKAPVCQTMPLATRMRPRSLDEIIGQAHILGEGRLLRRAIEADRISSILLQGPPGTGKTTIAQVIAASTRSRFERLSGVESNTADMRKILASAQRRSLSGGQRSFHPTLLFIDEIHRFNKAQQDILLPAVEDGTIRLIGATTQNLFFSVNAPLISRSQIFQLEPLAESDLIQLMERALRDTERGLGNQRAVLDGDAGEHLARMSDGDARKCLNALEIAVLSTSANSDGIRKISLAVAEESIQKKAVVYDGSGDTHYDTASAFIKSMRGSDPDATLYWLAKMLHAGEEIRFIARRIVICASEDVGLADSQALLVALAAQQAVEFLGMPEAQIPLAHAAVYVATAPKSNSAYIGLDKALTEIGEGRTLAIPVSLRDTHYKGAQRLDHGKGYQYPHDYEGNFVPQAYLPEGRIYYDPTENGWEKRIKERLHYWRRCFEQSRENP